MAEEMKQELSAEEAEQLALVENDRDALSALVDDLSGRSRRKRQMAAHVMLLVAQREPELLSEFIPDLIDALYRPEAQTRWEILDTLTLLVPEHAKEIGAAFDGAEAALFDDLSSILHFSAFRLLVTWGATERGRSKKVWPILDEAIQCYHGDIEFQEMLVAVIAFSEGKLADEVAEELKSRMAFDAKSGRGVLKKRAAQIVESLS